MKSVEKSLLLGALMGVSLMAQNILLQGTVRGSNGEILSGVEVSLVGLALKDTTTSSGTFLIEQNATATSHRQVQSKGNHYQILGTKLILYLDNATSGSVVIHSVKGQEIDRQSFSLAPGVHRLSLTSSGTPLAQGIYTISCIIGTQKVSQRFVMKNFQPIPHMLADRTIIKSRTAYNDTLIFKKDGFVTMRMPIFTDTGTYNATLVVASSQTYSMMALPETGQTQSFTDVFGEDADYTIHPMGYIDNGDGTVTDTVTGLMWQKGQSPSLGYAGAVAYADTLSLGGYSDWRLPDAHEAFSILYHYRANPAMDTATFTTSDAEYWWSSTKGVDKVGRQWVTNAGGGIGSHDTLESVTAGGLKKMAVRCVRSSFTGVNAPSFTILSDSIVRDNNTGLEWSRYSVGKMAWDTALAYVENLTLGGYSDWRLPNVKELQSINDESRVNPSLDTLLFLDAKTLLVTGTKPGQKICEHWSSTTLVNHPESIWYVDFSTGLVSYALRASALQNVRPVRGGY